MFSSALIVSPPGSLNCEAHQPGSREPSIASAGCSGLWLQRLPQFHYGRIARRKLTRESVALVVSTYPLHAEDPPAGRRVGPVAQWNLPPLSAVVPVFSKLDPARGLSQSEIDSSSDGLRTYPG